MTASLRDSEYRKWKYIVHYYGEVIGLMLVRNVFIMDKGVAHARFPYAGAPCEALMAYK